MKKLTIQPLFDDFDELTFVLPPCSKIISKENLEINKMNVCKSIILPDTNDYDTGDILLFSDKTYIPSRIIEYVTDSKYSHTGIILRDPTYINPDLKGLYILESTGCSNIMDAEDKKIKFGVQIRKFEPVYETYDGAIMWRRLHIDRDEKFCQTIKDIHDVIHNKPYDINPKDWVESLFDIKLGNVQVTSRFFCSALVTYIYDKLGLVDKGTPWTIIRPKDLGTENIQTNRIKIINCILDKEIVIKKYDLYVHYIYNTY